MDGKIALEEHFAIDQTINDSNGFLPAKVWSELRSRLMDILVSTAFQVRTGGYRLRISSELNLV